MVQLAVYVLLVIVSKLYRFLLHVMSVILNVHDFFMVLLCLPDYAVISEVREPIFLESVGGNYKYS
jgi:hypothetical protein